MFFAEAETFIAAIYSAVKGHKPWFWYVIYTMMLIISIFVVMPFCLSEYVQAAVHHYSSFLADFHVLTIQYSGTLVSDRLVLKAWLRQLERESTKPHKYPPPVGMKRRVTMFGGQDVTSMALQDDSDDDG